MVTSYRNAEDGFLYHDLRERVAAHADDTELLALAVLFLGRTLLAILDEPDLDRAQIRLRARFQVAAREEIPADG
jgi:hypothetical protein